MASLTGLAANPNPNKSFEVLRCVNLMKCCEEYASTVASRIIYVLLKKMQILPNPGDSVSSLSFSPKSNLLVATSWDNQVALLMLCNLQLAFVTVIWMYDVWNLGLVLCFVQVRCWEIVGGNSQPKASISHDQPVWSQCFLGSVNIFDWVVDWLLFSKYLVSCLICFLF
jgi:mRNA export factor